MIQQNKHQKQNQVVENDNKNLLTEKQYAALFHKTEAWAQRQRWQGTGPIFIKLGKAKSAPILYSLTDIEAWIVSNKRRNTAST